MFLFADVGMLGREGIGEAGREGVGDGEKVCGCTFCDPLSFVMPGTSEISDDGGVETAAVPLARGSMGSSCACPQALQVLRKTRE